PVTRSASLATGLGPELGRRPQHGFDDVLVAGAAAQVAGQRPAHVLLGRVGVLVEERLGGQHHARRAEPALQTVLLPEALLQRMKLAGGGQALDGADLVPVDLDGQHGAGLHRAPVDQHGAGAASSAACSMVSAVSGCPARAWAASVAPMVEPPTPVSAMPARVTFPPLVSSATATPTVAKSPTRRSSLRYPPDLMPWAAGITASTTISSGSRTFWKGPVTKSAIGIVRVPPDPRATTE